MNKFMAKIIKNQLFDVEIKADIPYRYLQGRSNGVECKLKAAKEWLRDLENFLSEHKSPPGIDITIEPIYKDICSFCEREIELVEDQETKEMFCACCGETIEQINSN